MEYQSETFVTTNNATVEVGTVVHDGREFKALGSIIDESRGLIYGYPHKLPDGTRELRTWNGDRIEKIVLVRTWKQWLFGQRLDMYAYRMTFNDRVYSGRNGGMFGGDGMLLRLRARGRSK